DAPYERMPVFVKEGSIIPIGPELQYTSEKPASSITLFVYGGKDASFTLYEDEGTNYNYEKGAFANIDIKYNQASKQLIIGDRSGSFNGMLKTRTFNVVYIDSEKAQGLNYNAKPLKTIKYTGKKIIIQL
ncbi:DUF5110 domain-containing protein, partial [Pseudoxanthomonas sp. SGD-10]